MAERSRSGRRNCLWAEETSSLVPSFVYFSFHLALPIFSHPPTLRRNCQSKSFPPLRIRETLGLSQRAKERRGKNTKQLRDSENFRWRHFWVSIKPLIVLRLTYWGLEELNKESPGPSLWKRLRLTVERPHAMMSGQLCESVMQPDDATGGKFHYATRCNSMWQP